MVTEAYVHEQLAQSHNVKSSQFISQLCKIQHKLNNIKQYKGQ